MNSSEQGRLGEAAVIKALILEGYDVFIPIGGNTPCDLITLKDGKTQRVEVKSTHRHKDGHYDVQIGSVRYNSKKQERKPFSSVKADGVAIYMIEDDQVVYVDALRLHGKHSFRVRPYE